MQVSPETSANINERGILAGVPLVYWYFVVLGGLEAEAEFELRVLEDRDVVVVDVVRVLSHDLKLDEVVLVQHRCNVDAEDEVFGD